MASALYTDAGGFMTAEGTMTLAFGRAYGGSTVVYTGTSLPPPGARDSRVGSSRASIMVTWWRGPRATLGRTACT